MDNKRYKDDAPELIMLLSDRTKTRLRFLRYYAGMITGYIHLSEQNYTPTLRRTLDQQIAEGQNILLETSFEDVRWSELLSMAKIAGYRTTMIVTMEADSPSYALGFITDDDANGWSASIIQKSERSLLNMARYFVYCNESCFINFNKNDRPQLILRLLTYRLSEYQPNTVDYVQDFVRAAVDGGRMSHTDLAIVLHDRHFVRPDRPSRWKPAD